METVADAAFCNRCGERLPARCPGCGALNPPGSGFRYACGSPIAASSRFSPPPPARISCPRCSKTNEPGSAYCYSCGLPLDEPPLLASGRPSYIARYESSRARRGNRDCHERASIEEAAERGGCCECASVGESAGFWIRLVAFSIDIILCLAISISVYIFGYRFGDAGIGPISYWADEIFIAALYHAVQWSLWSTTVGKRIFNMYVVRTDGSKIGFWRAFARCLCYFVSGLPLAAGFLMTVFREDRRGLHDLICDTVVVRRR